MIKEDEKGNTNLFQNFSYFDFSEPDDNLHNRHRSGATQWPSVELS